MGYWREVYGTRSEDFIKGACAAVDTYAVYMNGKRYIGSPEKEAKEVMKEIREELSEQTNH